MVEIPVHRMWQRVAVVGRRQRVGQHTTAAVMIGTTVNKGGRLARCWWWCELLRDCRHGGVRGSGWPQACGRGQGEQGEVDQQQEQEEGMLR